jgi:hypothetical protein
MLESVMVYAHRESSYTMRPGDALQLGGESLHRARGSWSCPFGSSVLAHRVDGPGPGPEVSSAGSVRGSRGRGVVE